MATTKIIERLNTSSWTKATSATGNYGAYVIAFKDPASSEDVCSIDDLRHVVLELGIESGSSEILTVNRLKLDFKEETSSNKELNGKTAFVRIPPMPSPLYFKAAAFYDS